MEQRLPAARIPAQRILPRFAVRTAVVRDRRDACELPHHARVVQTRRWRSNEGGSMAVLAGVGPMGLAAINYAIHRTDRKPKLIVVTDIDQTRLDRAASLYSPAEAAKNGIELKYVNTGKMADPAARTESAERAAKATTTCSYSLRSLPVVEQGDAILGIRRLPELLRWPGQNGFQGAIQLLQRTLRLHARRGHQRRQYGRHEGSASR